jgi:3-methyladenine DNA glycosylase AlkC
VGTPFKEGLGRDAIERIARNVARAHTRFDRAQFVRDAMRGLDALELKQRVTHVIAALRAHLPKDVRRAVATLVAVAEQWEGGDPKDPLRGFAAWPVIDFVGVHGLEDFDGSLDALRVLTPLFSAEFAIRPFLDRDPQRALARIRGWTSDPSEHVRRLVSEGTRTRLPWGMRLRKFVEDPSPVVTLLETLKDDPSEYVRRSVANNLNDLAKDHPELVLRIAERWMKDASPQRQKLVRHATRTLVKHGHGDALSLHGANVEAEVRVGKLVVSPKRVRVGASVKIACTLTSAADHAERLVVDYALHHVKADGGRRPKVFKGAKLTLAPGEQRDFEKTHSFAKVTVRRYYPGRHELELLVNGAVRARAGFELLES